MSRWSEEPRPVEPGGPWRGRGCSQGQSWNSWSLSFPFSPGPAAAVLGYSGTGATSLLGYLSSLSPAWPPESQQVGVSACPAVCACQQGELAAGAEGLALQFALLSWPSGWDTGGLVPWSGTWTFVLFCTTPSAVWGSLVLLLRTLAFSWRTQK